MWDPAQFVGATHVSQPERDALAKLEGGMGPGARRLFAASTTTTVCSAGGTTGPGTSTSTRGCGST